MKLIIVLSALVAASCAFMVCPPNACDNVVQPLLDCKGGTLTGTGWCGCTDSCAKVEGESCSSDHSGLLLLGVPHTEKCDEGLECQKIYLEGQQLGNERCVKKGEMMASKRSMQCDTPCRRKSLQCTFSMVVYEGQWFAKCDLEGNFLAQQCNNKQECFCVDKYGTIDESTRVLGSANC